MYIAKKYNYFKLIKIIKQDIECVYKDYINNKNPNSFIINVIKNNSTLKVIDDYAFGGCIIFSIFYTVSNTNLDERIFKEIIFWASDGNALKSKDKRFNNFNINYFIKYFNKIKPKIDKLQCLT